MTITVEGQLSKDKGVQRVLEDVYKNSAASDIHGKAEDLTKFELMSQLDNYRDGKLDKNDYRIHVDDAKRNERTLPYSLADFEKAAKFIEKIKLTPDNSMYRFFPNHRNGKIDVGKRYIAFATYECFDNTSSGTTVDWLFFYPGESGDEGTTWIEKMSAAKGLPYAMGEKNGTGKIVFDGGDGQPREVTFTIDKNYKILGSKAVRMAIDVLYFSSNDSSLFESGKDEEYYAAWCKPAP